MGLKKHRNKVGYRREGRRNKYDHPLSRASIRGVRGFLGLAGYFGKFIRHFGSLVAPLTQILLKEGFQWNQSVELAFKRLKEAFTSPPILCLPNFSQQFFFEFDASATGIRAILSQINRPMAISV